MLRAVVTGCLLSVANTDALADVDESDALAVALGYKADTTKVDSAKYANHATTQQRSSCKQFQGAVTDRSGGCTLFGGKVVSAKGWCSSWAKKA